MSVAAFRLLAGGFLLLVAARTTGGPFRPAMTLNTLARIALAGLLLAMFQAAYFSAAEATSVGLTTLTVMVSVTVMVAVRTAVVQRRPMSAQTTGVIVTAVLGLVLLLGGAADAGGGSLFAGTVLALISAPRFHRPHPGPPASARWSGTHSLYRAQLPGGRTASAARPGSAVG